MELTTEQRREVREVLIRAKTCLWDGRGDVIPRGKYVHICTCIYPYNYVPCMTRTPAIILADQFIHARLSGTSTLVIWLMHADPDGVDPGVDEEARLWAHYGLNTPKLQATRHAWIDSMIAELA